MRNIYMVNGGALRRRSKTSEMIRVFAPYVVLAALALFLILRERSNNQAVTDPEKGADWTHKLSLNAEADDENRPDDNNRAQCPLPKGNWESTCLYNLTIEGPCNGRCLLKANCEDLDQVLRPTTFQFESGSSFELKNVNGLLCRVDGATACGVNFHGNLARLQCHGNTPRRHEYTVKGRRWSEPVEADATAASPSSPDIESAWNDHEARKNERAAQQKTSATDVESPLIEDTVVEPEKSWPQPAEAPAAPSPDWTHRISTRQSELTSEGPNDHNERSCPTPRGNWQNTCLKNISIEGPCAGRCLFKANCEDTDQVFREATFNFPEGHRVEIKNVNGLLCRLDPDSGAPLCGVNFHGNIAQLHCEAYIPRRKETTLRGRELPVSSDDMPPVESRWKLASARRRSVMPSNGALDEDMDAAEMRRRRTTSRLYRGIHRDRGGEHPLTADDF